MGRTILGRQSSKEAEHSEVDPEKPGLTAQMAPQAPAKYKPAQFLATRRQFEL